MRLRAALAGTLVALGAALPASAAEHAVILLYHHVSEETPASTSVTPDVFDSHLDYLSEKGFTVLPLERVVEALGSGESLPDRSVVLTFDDAYDSIYTEALPRLEQRGWPFTVFVATDGIDSGYDDLMTWDELRDIEARGGTLANHTTDHSHLVRREAGGNDWAQLTRTKIIDAQARLEAELENPLHYLAWPYGEFDSDLEAIAADLGFVAFGQQSGPVGRASPRTQLARFPVATGYDDLESLGEKLRTQPMPVTVLEPQSRVLSARARAPTLRIRVENGPFRTNSLRCYVAGQDPAEVSWNGNVATITAQERLGPGRSKFNCTMPSSYTPTVFYWYSHLWIKPQQDGSWYEE